MNQNVKSQYRRPPLSKIWLAVCSGLLVSSAGSYAADNTSVLTVTASDKKAQTDDGYSSPTTSVASKTPTSKLDEAQSISEVTNKQLQDYQSTNLSDAMRFVSGASQANTLGQTEDGIVRRGFGSNSDGSVFRDGIRSSQGLNLDATTDHVEVLKGSSSLLYGILNPGGMINVVSKKPQYEWHTIVGGHYNSTGGGAGNIDITGPLGNGFAFRLIAEKQDQNYWRGFGNEKHNLLAPSLQWYGDKASFNISYEDYQYDIPYDRGTAFINGKPIDIGYKTRLDDYSNHAWGRNQTFSSHWDYQFNDIWSTRVTVGLNQRKYNSNTMTTTAVNTTTGVVTRRPDAFRGFNHKTKYVSWDAIGTPEILGMTHNMVFGTDYEMNQTYRAHAYNGKKNTDFTLSHPVYGLETITDSSTEKTADSNLLNRLHSRSVYFKDSIDLTNDWTAVAGARYQHYEQRESRGAQSTLTYSDTGNKFLPQTGLIYKLTPDVSFYGSLSKSFTPSTTPDDYGNVAAPEQGTTYEVGSKWQITPALLSTIALYRIDERNVALALNGSTYAVDRARSSGVEFEVNGEIYPDWDISANYSYDQAEIVNDKTNSDNNGNRLQNAPRNSGSVYLSHNIRFNALPGSFRIGGGVRYMGTRAGDADNSFTLPAYTVADSFIGWDNQFMGQKTHLQLNLNNLFNKEYYTSSGGNLRVIEGETRNLVLSASVEF
ncbi:TonB-dependent siderophore receptor [Tatumella sp. JGM118]|uniref:TonB-dependent siderophore receptor n=1 Tax=Tatumella sp. JGM118 TaxID=2799796 RepID=UPI001BB027AB|nr:TonB-dependent siderophore receptor [Tatumella sp. JGM118]MBS0908086.1 TonB-dependent siderophore receptor [Tatumella sp. JGM118]